MVVLLNCGGELFGDSEWFTKCKLCKEGDFLILYGMSVITNETFTDGYKEIPKRKSKSKRIQKKWNKKYGFYCVPIPSKNLFIFDGKIMGHPKTIKKVMDKINNNEALKS